MVFVLLGLLVSPIGLGLVDLESNLEAILTFAEAVLVITLLSNAAAVDTRVLRTNRIPLRLLLIGLPLTIAMGGVLAALVFGNITMAEAGLIGAVLAPTDANLGQAIIKNERIPARIRQALDVESGLNDGGSVPFFALFLIIARAEVEQVPPSSWVTFAAEQIVLSILFGVVAGLVGSFLLNRGADRGWMKRGTQSITLVSLALLTWLATNALGGSGFIGAYMAGLIIAARRRHIDQEAIELANVEAETLSLGVFFILGLAVAFFFPSIGLVTVIYAILSLTVVRMAPVAAALVGAGCGRRSCLFMGWFGPPRPRLHRPDAHRHGFFPRGPQRKRGGSGDLHHRPVKRVRAWRQRGTGHKSGF